MSTTNKLQEIQQAINLFDFDLARQMIRDEMQVMPSADLFVLAARVAQEMTQKQLLIARALHLDPTHIEAKAMHEKLSNTLADMTILPQEHKGSVTASPQASPQLALSNDQGASKSMNPLSPSSIAKQWHGYKIGFPGSGLGLIALFLPWVLYSCEGGRTPESFSGFYYVHSFLNEPNLQLGGIVLFLALGPILGLILSLFFAGRGFILTKIDAFGLFLSGFGATIAVFFMLTRNSDIGNDASKIFLFMLGFNVAKDGILQGQYGLLIAIASYISMMIGGVINWHVLKKLKGKT